MAKERKVVYSLEVVEGGGNKQAFANTEAGIKAATAALKEHTAARKEFERTSAASQRRAGRVGGSGSAFSEGMDRAAMNAAKQAATDERRERERNIADIERAAQRERRVLAERVRANVEASRAISAAAREANAAGWKRRQAAAGAGGSAMAGDMFSDADAKQAVGEIAREHTRAEQAAKRHHAEQMKVLNGYAQIGGAITQAARAAIFFGATNEETAQKMLKMVLYAEGIVSAFSAAKNLAQGLGKVLGPSAFGGAGGAAAGAAGAAGAGWLTKAGLAAGGAAAAKFSGIAALAGAGGFALDAGRSLIRGESVTGNWRDLGTAATDMIGFTDSAGDNRRGWDARLGNVSNRETAAARAAGFRTSRWSANMSFDSEEWRTRGGIGGAITNTQAALAAAQQEQAGVLGNQGSSLSARIEANQKVVELAQRLKDLTREKVQIEVDGDRKSLAAADERIRKVQAERDVRMSQLAAAGGERRSAAIEFAGMSRSEQARATAAFGQAQTGNIGAIPRADLDLLARAGGSFGQSVRDEVLIGDARKSGFGKFEKELFNPVEQGLVASGRNLTTTLKNEVSVKMELELKTSEEMVNKRIEAAMKPIWQQVRLAVVDQLELAARADQQQQAEEIRRAQEAAN